MTSETPSRRLSRPESSLESQISSPWRSRVDAEPGQRGGSVRHEHLHGRGGASGRGRVPRRAGEGLVSRVWAVFPTEGGTGRGDLGVSLLATVPWGTVWRSRIVAAFVFVAAARDGAARAVAAATQRPAAMGHQPSKLFLGVSLTYVHPLRPLHRRTHGVSVAARLGAVYGRHGLVDSSVTTPHRERHEERASVARGTCRAQ